MMKRLRSMKKLASAAVFLMLATLVFPFTIPVAIAQATTGGIQGVVYDVNRAVVPNAPVTAKNNGTGAESKTTTTAEGLYNIPKLAAGRYSVTVEVQGFKKSEAPDVEVSIGRHTVVDITLQPGSVSESVTVTGTTEVLIEKDTAQVSGRFSGKTITDLPIAGGGGLDRIALAMPGIYPGFSNVNGNGTTLSVNGNRARANNFTVDGADNNDLTLGGPGYFISNKEVVQEIQVVTSNFSAENGRNAGAMVNYVSKAGTNDYHGAVTWYHRDRYNWDSRTNIEKRRGDLHPPRNLINVVDFGVGGPVGIPKLISGKDKLFFFVAGEFFRNPGVADQTTTLLAVTPPGLATLKAAFPNNPAIQYYVNYSPFAIPAGNPQIRPDVAQSTVTIGSVTVPVAAVRRVSVVPNNSNEYNIRIDSNVSSKNKVFGRYFHQSSPNPNALIGVDGWTGDQPVTGIIAGGTWLYNLSSRSLNEFRFNYSKLGVEFGGGCGDPTTPGCVPSPKDIDKALTNFNIQFTAANGQSLLNIGPATNLPQARIVKSYNFADNYSITRGLHQIKVGADIHRLLNDAPFLPTVNGSYLFSTAAQFAANTPAQLTVALGPSTLDYTEWDKFFYFQDDWRIKPNLTLNLGVRYENTGQPINLLHDITVKRENDPNQAFWRQNLPLEARTVPKIPTDKNNFAPRLGFVWTPKFKSGMFKRMFGEDATVIRGGYGISYDAVFYNLLLNISTSAPLVFLTSAVLPVPDAVPTGDKVRGSAISAGLIKFNTFDPRLLSRTLVDSNFRSPYIQQWSLGVQRQLSRDYVIETRYVGNHQVGLFQTINANPFLGNLINGFTRTYRDPGGAANKTFTFPGFPNLFPGVTPLTCTDNPATPDNEGACNGRLFPSGPTRQRINGAMATYHGLQNRFEGRYKDLHFGANYTWSHAIDNSSEVFQANGGNSVVVAQNPLDITRGEKGDSGFDIRHGFSAYWVWDIPVMKEQHGILGHILGGWQLNGVARVQSERRFNPIMQSSSRNPYDDSTTMITFFGSQGQMRPFSGNPKIPLMPNGTTLVGITDVDACIFYGKCGTSGGQPILIPSSTGFYLMNDLNKGIFTPVTPNDVRFIINGPGAAMKFGTPFGNIGRNTFRGDRVEAFDFSVFKTTKIGERFAIQYRFNMFNALNHPTFGIPNSIRLDNAGTTFFNFQENSGGRRTLEMAIRISF